MDSTALTHTHIGVFGKISESTSHFSCPRGFVTLYWKLFSLYNRRMRIYPNTVQGVTAVLVHHHHHHHHLSAPCSLFAMLRSVDVKPRALALTAHDSVVWTAVLQNKRENIMSRVILVMNGSFSWAESIIYSLFTSTEMLASSALSVVRGVRGAELWFFLLSSSTCKSQM